MKANELVKKFGLMRVKYWIREFTEINKLPNEMINLEFLNDLKRLIESWELVEKHGGLSGAKEYLKGNFIQYHMSAYARLKQAIADVESCQ